MSDKVQLIKDEIERRINISIEQGYTYSATQLKRVIDFIDSLPKEPASEDLEEEIDRYYSDWQFDDDTIYEDMRDICRHFAEWQKQQMIKDAVELHIAESFNPVGTENEKLHGFTALYYNAKYPDFYPVTGQTIKVIPTKEIQQ